VLCYEAEVSKSERIGTVQSAVRLAFKIDNCSYGNSIAAEENRAHKSNNISQGIQLKTTERKKYIFSNMPVQIFAL
jgi:hypothetical protein